MVLGDLATASKRLEQAVGVFTAAPPAVQAETRIRRDLAFALTQRERLQA